jgi:hypothetical protein
MALPSMTRSAETSTGPSGVLALTPTTRPASWVRVVTSALKFEPGIALRPLLKEIEKVPLRHKGHKAAACWQPGEIAEREFNVSEPRRECRNLLMRELQKNPEASPVPPRLRALKDEWCRRENRARSPRAIPAQRHQCRRGRTASRSSAPPDRPHYATARHNAIGHSHPPLPRATRAGDVGLSKPSPAASSLPRNVQLRCQEASSLDRRYVDQPQK